VSSLGHADILIAPFILAVRNASKRAILGAFERRLKNGAEAERDECIAQVHKIAWMRMLVLYIIPA
jgi:2-oxo-4-hydroxy-4-carboxy--5-ureidoimidazoline (OHCU) decarboxylase